MRDITRLSLKADEDWIIASDISSGIGLQEHDVLAVPYTMVGAFAARVAMLEILCARGTVKAIQYLIGGDYDTVVTSVVQGIQEELDTLGIDVPINGSHESNMKVSTTSVGITALGVGAPEVVGKGEPYAVYVLGKPLVGNEVLEQPEWIVTYDEVRRVLGHPSTSRVVPIGSRGIRQELTVVNYLEGASIESIEMTDDELDHSGGPATAVVVAVRTSGEDAWVVDFPKAQYVGRHR
jgi:hypothetical protein